MWPLLEESCDGWRDLGRGVFRFRGQWVWNGWNRRNRWNSGLHAGAAGLLLETKDGGEGQAERGGDGADGFSFQGEGEDGVHPVFAPGGAALLAEAAGMVDEDDGAAGAALFARPGFDGQPGFDGVFPAASGEGGEIVHDDEIDAIEMILQPGAVGMLGEVQLVVLQIHGEETKIFFLRRWREQGAGRLQVLDGHFAVDEEDAAGGCGVPAEQVGTRGDGVGDGEGEPGFADAAGAMDEGEGGFRQPGGEQEVAWG